MPPRTSAKPWGSARRTLGTGTLAQASAAVAAFATLPLQVQLLGTTNYGALVVVMSLGPWLTLLDGALQPSMRLLAAERRHGFGDQASPSLLRSGYTLALQFAAANSVTLALGLTALPVVTLFGAPPGLSRTTLVVAVACFAIPILLSSPGSVALGALEGVGRTSAAAVFAASGPLLALPLTAAAVLTDRGLWVIAGIQGLSVAAPRIVAWGWWLARPSVASGYRGHERGLELAVVASVVTLSLTNLVQQGLDPVIVASKLGSEAAASYGIASRLLLVALMPLFVLTPLLMGNLAAARGSGEGSEAPRAYLTRVLRLFSLAGMTTGTLVALIGPSVGRFLGRGEVATPSALFIAGGLLVFGTYVTTPLFAAFMGPSGLRASLRLSVVLATVNVIMSILLTGPLGPAGPLWVSAGCCLPAALYWWYALRRQPSWLVEVHGSTPDNVR